MSYAYTFRVTISVNIPAWEDEFGAEIPAPQVIREEIADAIEHMPGWHSHIMRIKEISQ